MPECLDLRTRFGDRYRLRKEADGATWYATPEAERPWLLELPCRYGVVYPQGGEILAAVVTGRLARDRVAALPCIRSRRGDAELVVTFHVDAAEAVLAILKPRRRRQVSDTEWARLRAIGFQHSEDDSRGVSIDAATQSGPGAPPDAADAGNLPEVAPDAGSGQ